MQVLDPLKRYAIRAASLSTAYITISGANSNSAITYANLTLTAQPSNLFLPFNISTSVFAPPKLNICTSIGSNRLCMDQDGNNKTQAALQVYGDYTGQQWTLNGSLQSNGDTLWTMQSDFAGPDLYLAAAGSNVAMLPNTSTNAIYWDIIDTSIPGAIPSAASSSSIATTSASTTVSAVTVTITPSSASSSAPASTSTRASSASLNSGIPVGTVLTVVAGGLLALTAFML